MLKNNDKLVALLIVLLAGAAFGVQKPTSKIETCVTSECHADYGLKTYVHGPVSLGDNPPNSAYENEETILYGENIPKENQMNLALSGETPSAPIGQRTSPQEVKPQKEAKAKQEAKAQQEAKSQKEAKPKQEVKPKTSATTGNAVAAPT